MWSLNKCLFMIITAIFANVRADNGYNYHNPAVTFNLPNQHQYQEHSGHQEFRPTVNALSYNHYNYQQQHNDNSFQPLPNLQSYAQHSIQNPPNQQHYSTDGFHYNSVQMYPYNQLNQNLAQIYPQEQKHQASPIKKYIYFHIPPPELERPQYQIPVALPKKTYKIIFIKLPAQESKNQVLVQQLHNLQHQFEEKTLIYVLVKKPEDQSDLLPKNTVHSKPEVFYVKYKQNPLDVIASQVNLGLGGYRDNSAAELQPGLVNGHPLHYDH